MASRVDRASLALGVAAIVAVAALPGCATKKFVLNKINPLSKRVDTLETAIERHGQDIEELEREVSLADEHAMTADQKAVEAAQAAEMARAEAEKAQDEAGKAQSSAERALRGVDTLANRLEALDDYEVVAQETVLFAFASSKLSDEAKQQLDAAASQLTGEAPFVIEVRGFTDKTGNPDYNLALSEKRAQAVVRYLITQHNIPLHRIFTAGLGSENPAADNTTREGRKMNRRVEVTVYRANAPALAAGL